MDSLAIVEHRDVLEDRRSSRLAAREHAAINEFELQRCKEALDNGIVPAVALSRHARDHAEFGQSATVRCRRIGLSSIAVVDQAVLELTLSTAISSASRTSAVFLRVDMDQPTTDRA